MMGIKHAEAIAEFGGIPFLLDIDDKKGIAESKRISREYKTDCIFRRCDITDELQVINAKDYILKKYDNIYGLINNAAIDPKYEKKDEINLSRFENFSVKQWNHEIAVGLTGAMICSKIFGYEMSKKKCGVILNISSDLGLIAPDQRIYSIPGIKEDQQPVKPITYSVIKHGIIGLTKYLSTFWGHKGVRCNTLCPGGIFNGHEKDFVEKLTNLIPLGRMAEKDEYKAAIIFLMSDASSYMNGSNIVMDGGRTVW